VSEWYRQNPLLKNGTAFQATPLPPVVFQSLEEEVAFLRQQLDASIGLIKQKDATEAACIERVTRVYTPIQERLTHELKESKRQLEREKELLRATAHRYQLLRTVRVRAMQLGINNLSGEELDRALDAQAQARQTIVSDPPKDTK
jgi:hypothetical protein